MNSSFWLWAVSVHHLRLIMLLDPVTKDPSEAEVLSASFASVLNSKICPHKLYTGSGNHPRLLKLMYLRKK